MARSNIQLIKTNCKRCGKELYTTNKSIHGLDSLKEKWGSICKDCITPQEEHEMLLEQGLGIQKRFAR